MHYAGDAVLAMFDAVVDAVSCATEIQDKLRERNQELPNGRKVQFRIGVNLGDVIEDRGDIYGDGCSPATGGPHDCRRMDQSEKGGKRGIGCGGREPAIELTRSG